MTENQAIETMKYRIKTATEAMGKGVDGKAYEDMEMAIAALQEIQKYRSIGTVDEIQELKQWRDEHREDIAVDLAEYRDLCSIEETAHLKSLKRIIERNGTIGRTLDKCAEYEEIGTVEQFREAMEKQIPKKPILCMNEKSGMFVDYADGHGEYKTQMNNWWRCPCCNDVVGQRVIVHEHVHDQKKKNYCEKCGQNMDWNETKKGSAK